MPSSHSSTRTAPVLPRSSLVSKPRSRPVILPAYGFAWKLAVAYFAARMRCASSATSPPIRSPSTIRPCSQGKVEVISEATEGSVQGAGA